MGCMGGYPGFGGGPSGYSIRNDPNREKTPQDIEKLKKAKEKRERKRKN